MYHVEHAPPYFWHTWCVFLKQDARGNLVQELVPVFFPLSAFCHRFLKQTSIGRSKIIPFLLTQSFSNWHSLMWHKPPLIAKSTHYSSGKESQRDFQICESRLIVACLMTASGQLPRRSSHLIMFQLVPCTLFNLIVQTFLAAKSFAAGSSMDPCHLACVLKSVPRDFIPSIGCSTQLPRSAVGVTGVSRGWLLNTSFLRSSWSSGFLCCFAHDNASEQSLLAETLEGGLRGTPRV